MTQPPNRRRSDQAAVRHGSPGCDVHDGTRWSRAAAGRRRELPNGRQVSEMGTVVGHPAYASPVSVVVCGTRYLHAAAGRKYQQSVGRERGDEPYWVCLKRDRGQASSDSRRFLRAESRVGCR